MKNLVVLLLLVAGFSTQAQNKNAKANLEVDGVCMMCKVRIEKAALKTPGVKSAVWNVESHNLSLIYNEKKTDLKKVEASLAAAGHDTQNLKAADEVYNAIDDCCKYRDPEVLKDHGIEVDDDGGN